MLLLHGSGPGVSAWANWRLVLPSSPSASTSSHRTSSGSADRPPGDGRYGRAAWTRHALALVDAPRLERSTSSATPWAARSPSRWRPSGPSWSTGSSSWARPACASSSRRASTRSGATSPSPERDAPPRRAVRLRRRRGGDRRSREPPLPDEPRAAHARELRGRCSPRRASAGSTTSRSTRPTLRGIEQPALLIHGYEDEVIPFAGLEPEGARPAAQRRAARVPQLRALGADRADAALHAGPRGLPRGIGTHEGRACRPHPARPSRRPSSTSR